MTEYALYADKPCRVGGAINCSFIRMEWTIDASLHLQSVCAPFCKHTNGMAAEMAILFTATVCKILIQSSDSHKVDIYNARWCLKLWCFDSRLIVSHCVNGSEIGATMVTMEYGIRRCASF